MLLRHQQHIVQLLANLGLARVLYLLIRVMHF